MKKPTEESLIQLHRDFILKLESLYGKDIHNIVAQALLFNLSGRPTLSSIGTRSNIVLLIADLLAVLLDDKLKEGSDPQESARILLNEIMSVVKG